MNSLDAKLVFDMTAARKYGGLGIVMINESMYAARSQ
jgi:hypothetical protein